VIAFDGDTRVCFGTQNGVSFFDGESWTNYTSKDGLLGSYVTCVVFDAEHNAWVGTDNGLSVFDGKKWTGYTTKDGLAGDVICAIEIDSKGQKWVVASDRISAYTPEKLDSPGHRKPLPRRQPLRFAVSRYDGNRFASAVPREGAFFPTMGGSKLHPYSEVSPGTWIATDSSGKIWFGVADKGIWRHDWDAWTTFAVTPTLAADNVMSVAIDHDGRKWFATTLGLSCYDGSRWTTYTTKNGLPSDSVSLVSVGGDDSIWVVTKSRHLSRLKNGQWANL
jgi:ligand-binding sensor domain-containing protein